MIGQYPIIAPRHLFEFAVRTTLIAAGTASALGMLRVAAPAVRHRAWTGVAVLMMLLPFWTAYGPKASLRLLPAMTPAVETPAAGGPITLSEMVLTGAAAPAPRQPIWSWSVVPTGIYLLGVGVLLTRLIVGTVRAQILVRRAMRRGGRLTSGACAAPITVGWLRPAVILPDCWQRWPQAQLEAVLAHEGEHARRRDPLVQWLVLLNRAVFWFHPLAWWLESRLTALAEEACDAAVLARGHDPFEYSEYLLEMARSVVRTGARVKVLGMAMPGSCLPQRIQRILEGRPAQRISQARMACLAAACAMLSAVFATAAVERRAPAHSAEGPIVALQAAPVQPDPAPSPARPTTAARLLLVAQAQTAPAPAPAAAAAQAASNNRRMVVLYFDLRAMPAPERSRAFAAAQQYIRTKMQPNDLLSIIADRADVKVLQDFTEDRTLLLRSIDRLMADPGPEPDAAVDPNQQLIGLHTAVQMLGSVSGKKAVICFWTDVERADSAQLRTLIDAAIRANVAFYSVDSQGLILNPPPDARERQLEEALQKLARSQRELADRQTNEQRRTVAQLQQEIDQLNARRGGQPAAYIIAAGDTLQIWVGQPPEVSAGYTVRPDGIVSVPLVGDVRAAGLTVLQLEAVIGDRLETNGIVKRPSVTVGVAAVHR